jgi:hypothetical protein
MPLNEMKKEWPFPGKGHNVTFEIVIPMEHPRFAKNAVKVHVSENGGTCVTHFCVIFIADVAIDLRMYKYRFPST